MAYEIRNNAHDEELENLAKLVALRAAIAEGIASGSEDSEVAFARWDVFMDELVAQEGKTDGQ